MSDSIHGKPGVATRPPSDKEAPLPLEKRGTGKMPAAKGRQKDAVLSKPGIVSAPPSRPSAPSPAAEARRGEPEPLLDPAELSKQTAEIAAKSRQLVAAFLTRQGREEGDGMADSLGIGTAFLEMTARMMADPSRLVQGQLWRWNEYMSWCQSPAQPVLAG